MINDVVKQLLDNKNITEDEAYSVMSEIMSGMCSEALISAYLVALRMKGETSDEIAGSVRAMKEASIHVKCDAPVIIDTCGTGGDAQFGFNVSTVAAFVVAGAGFTVAKHGNKSVSSKCGSADLLEALGVPIDEPVEDIERRLNKTGFAFQFAPKMHPAMKYAMPVRKQLGTRTIFNILGPLANPASTNVQIVGVFSPSLVEKLSAVLPKIGVKQGMIVHGDGFDEITLSGETKVAESDNGKIRLYTIKPEDFGFKRVEKALLKGGSIEDNVKITHDILQGKTGPHRDMVLLNAGAAIMLAKRASDEPVTYKEAIKIAAESIDSKAALNKLEVNKK